MENSGFQSQLLAVVEVLAKAAVAEINRSVEDGCAVLRLEVSQSRRDIDLLKRKCEGMEAELRRTRMRARRKVFCPPAAERFCPLVKVVLNKESQSSGWDAEAQNQHQQRADVEPSNEAQHILIKEERDEEESDSRDKLISGAEQQQQHYCSAEDAGPLVSPADAYHTFPWQPLDVHLHEHLHEHLNEHLNEPQLAVKCEKPDQSAAPVDPTPGFLTEEADRSLWSSDLCGSAVVSGGFSGADDRFEPIPSPSRSGPPAGPQALPAGKSHSASVSAAARAKRRARALGLKRSQPDGGHGGFSRINAAAQCSAPHQSTLQCRDSPRGGNPSEDAPPASSSSSFFCGHSRGGFGLPRRMRTPWRSGLGEKRFSCTYCDKSFVRFSQLKEHLRSHTGEKPFSCLQCGRSFTKQCNLIRHAVVHSGEKPYECSLCGKCFTQRSSLKSHQKTAH